MVKDVVLVFEPTTDLHWMKDVIQLPKALAKFTGGTAHAIVRPNHKQSEVAKHITLHYFEKENTENYDCFETSDFTKQKTDPIWYLKACKKASEVGEVLVTYNFFGNSRRGALVFKLSRWMRFKKAFVLLKSDGTLDEWIDKQYSLKKKLWDYLKYFFIDQIICENESIYSNLRSNNHHLFSKVVYIPLCPLEIYNSQIPKPYIIRPNTFLLVGRVNIFQKGTDILLETWIKVCKKIPDWRLQLVGSCTDEFKQEWIKRLSDEKANDSVIWISELNPYELLECYNNSKIVVCTSRWESGPIILSEAALSGCAFIGTPVGEIPAMLNGLPGLVNKIEDLEETMLLFAKNSKMAMQQAKELNNRLKDRNWEKQVENIKL